MSELWVTEEQPTVPQMLTHISVNGRREAMMQKKVDWETKGRKEVSMRLKAHYCSTYLSPRLLGCMQYIDPHR